MANSWKLGFDATQVVLEKNNIDRITEELYHECTRYCTPDRLARHAGLLPGDEEFEREGERLGQEFDELYVGLVSVETAGFYDGIHNLLLSLPKDDVKIAALTNACVAYAYSVLQINCPVMSNQNGNEATDDDQNGIYKRFISIHGADTVPKPKPDPAGLYQICNEIEIDPSVCVYIGDSPSDAVAAKEAGMIAIGVLWGSVSIYIFLFFQIITYSLITSYYDIQLPQHPVESLRKAPFDFLCNNVQDLYDLLLE